MADSSSIKSSLEDITAALAELKHELSMINVRLDGLENEHVHCNGTENTTVEQEATLASNSGARHAESPTEASPEELSGAHHTRGLMRARENMQDHMFKIAMKSKEREAQKRAEEERLRASRRLRIIGNESSPATSRGFAQRLLLPWSENAIIFGLVPIPANGTMIKTSLEIFTILLVLLSVSIIIMQSYSLYEDLQNHPELFMVQIILLIFFTFEYIVRWWAVRPAKTIPRPYSIKEYYTAKLMYTVSFMPVIDLLSILPFYIELILIAAGEEQALPGSALMVFRVVRVLRIFKLTRNNQTIVDFTKAMGAISSDLVVFLAVLATCVVLISTMIFYAERSGDHADLYPDIPTSMWWTVITFTSVGYGDVYPVTDAGRCVGAFAALLGVLLMNIPIAFVLISFDEVYSARKARENRMTRIVQHVFAWADRHKKVNPIKHLEAQKTGSLAGRNSALKLYRKREIYRIKKERKKAKQALLDALMYPGSDIKAVGDSVDEDIELRNKTENDDATEVRRHYLEQKYFWMWRNRVMDARRIEAKRKYKFIKKRRSSSTIFPAEQVVQRNTASVS